MTTLSAMSTLYFKTAKPTKSLSLGLIAALRREWSYIAAARALNRLDDAALRDIGVSRERIDEAVRHTR